MKGEIRMVNKMIIENSIIVIIDAPIINKFGLLLPALMLLTILMITDFISGMLAAKKESLDHPNNKNYRWNSKKSITGIYKKVGYLLIVLVAISTDFILIEFATEIGIKFEQNAIFGLLVSIWLITIELISILENAGRMGAKLPNILKKVLVKLQNDIDKNAN